MFRVKPIILLLVALISAFSVCAQSDNDGKSNSMNAFFGFDGLRLNNPALLYNQRFLRDSTYFFKKKLNLSPDLQLVKKIIFDYDNQGRLLVENEFENISDTWIESLKRIFNYNDNGGIEYSVIKQWNGFIEEFENQQRTFYFSNYLGQVSQEIIEMHNSEEWLPEWKHEYSYNDQSKIVEEVSHKWLILLMEWKPKRRKLYEYNANAALSSEIHQIWVDTLDTWVNNSFRIYEYNEDNQLINLRHSSWNKSLEQWVEQSFQALSYTVLGQVENSSLFNVLDADAEESVEATYDEDGNLNMTLFSVWNDQQEAWNLYGKKVHFWSQYLIGNLDYTDNSIDCYYANPHTIGLPWYCNSLLDSETYNLSVFDHNGVLHHSQQFRGSDTFRLTKNLNNGLYMIVITGGLTVHTEKVLIRN